MTFPAEFVRVYYNRGTDAPKLWSVDCGPGTVEMLCAFVVVKDCQFATNQSNHDAAMHPNDPKAWIEAYGVIVKIKGGGITIGKKPEAQGA